MSLKYLKLKIDNEELDIDTDSEFPITFDYQLEDTQDFQKKKSSESIGMKLPATLKNQKILNTFQNTSVEDNTPNKIYKGIRNIVAEANGIEVFVGKAIPKRTTKRGAVPISFELNCFGNNADWMISLKETTIYELVKQITLVFNKNTIENSWNFDGTNENLPYVFAPVKYAGWMDEDLLNDKNYSVKTMKPSLSLYWILYWGFKSVGYKIQSNFFDTPYARKLVMPWTYGAFLSSEGTKYEIHRFLAKSYDERTFYDNTWGCNLIVYDNTDSGCYDNNNTISTGNYTGNNELLTVVPTEPTNGNAGVVNSPIHIPAGIGGASHGGGDEMRWTYNTPYYGLLEVNLLLTLEYSYRFDVNTNGELDVYWFKKDGITGVTTQIQYTRIFYHGENTDGQDIANIRLKQNVNPGDSIICKVWVGIDKDSGDIGSYADTYRVTLKVLEFSMEHINIPINGTISFDSYLTLQKNKFLDLLKGAADLFNLSIQTDPINKIVLIEPTHDFSLSNNLAIKQEGYFTKNTLSFNEDISEDSIIEFYDDNAREFVFKFKDDTNDGALKIVQDRYKIILASGKYVFSERFKAEKKEFENRYFSPVMHYLVDDFSTITGITPQMICLVPENISNTSSSEAQNTFSPKIAYYKGLIVGVGGWKFDGVNQNSLPYMFAVNYKAGGDSDPILSYSDENIGSGGNVVVGKGLLKRFFWQRMAIMNNGQWLNTQFMLNNNHITNWFHRERIDLNGELWELISIKGFNCLNDNSTKATLRKWVPISKEQLDNTYPSETSILKNAVIVIIPPAQSDPNTIDKVFDTQYNRLMCLYNDIPKPQ